MPKWSNSRLLKNYREIRDGFCATNRKQGLWLIRMCSLWFQGRRWESREKLMTELSQSSEEDRRRRRNGHWCRGLMFQSKEGEASTELGEVNKPPLLSCKQSLRLQKLAHLFCTIKFIEVWQGKFSRQWSRKPATAEPSIWVNGTISWFSFYLSI